jgi:hypothetical protein
MSDDDRGCRTRGGGRREFKYRRGAAEDAPDDLAFTLFLNGDPRIRLTLRGQSTGGEPVARRWVERTETHRRVVRVAMGFRYRSTHPTRLALGSAARPDHAACNVGIFASAPAISRLACSSLRFLS